MKKSGFTLIELMGVIILLALIGLIAIPIIDNAIKNAREVSYEEQVKTLEEGAKKWATTHTEELPTLDSEKLYLTVNDLKLEGIIRNVDVKDPRNDKIMDGCLVITYQTTFKRYLYTYHEETCDDLKK